MTKQKKSKKLHYEITSVIDFHSIWMWILGEYLRLHLADAFIQSNLQWLIHTNCGVNHLRRQPACQEQLGLSVLLTSTLGGAGDRTSNLPVTSQPALPPEQSWPEYCWLCLTWRRLECYFEINLTNKIMHPIRVSPNHNSESHFMVDVLFSTQKCMSSAVTCPTFCWDNSTSLWTAVLPVGCSKCWVKAPFCNFSSFCVLMKCMRLLNVYRIETNNSRLCQRRESYSFTHFGLCRPMAGNYRTRTWGGN